MIVPPDPRSERKVKKAKACPIMAGMQGGRDGWRVFEGLQRSLVVGLSTARTKRINDRSEAERNIRVKSALRPR